jgi:hypothetical protein
MPNLLCYAFSYAMPFNFSRKPLDAPFHSEDEEYPTYSRFHVIYEIPDVSALPPSEVSDDYEDAEPTLGSPGHRNKL